VERMSFEPGTDKKVVMDGDSGDEGNDELTCVRSDVSDVFMISRQAKFLQFIGKLIPETECCVTEVTTSEERVLRWC